MKNEKTIETKTESRDARQEMRNEIIGLYNEFIEDYPKNRDKILGYFDEGISLCPDNPRIKAYLSRVKNAFLEAEKTL